MDVISACDVAATASDTPALATFLSVLFSVYIALDSLLAAAVIVRKAGEAEKATLLASRGGTVGLNGLGLVGSTAFGGVNGVNGVNGVVETRA